MFDERDIKHYLFIRRQILFANVISVAAMALWLVHIVGWIESEGLVGLVVMLLVIANLFATNGYGTAGLAGATRLLEKAINSDPESLKALARVKRPRE